MEPFTTGNRGAPPIPLLLAAAADRRCRRCSPRHWNVDPAKGVASSVHLIMIRRLFRARATCGELVVFDPCRPPWHHPNVKRVLISPSLAARVLAGTRHARLRFQWVTLEVMAVSPCGLVQTFVHTHSVFPGEQKLWGIRDLIGNLLENGLQREGAFCLGKGCFFRICCNLLQAAPVSSTYIVSAALIAICYLQQSNFVNKSFLLYCSIASPCGVPVSTNLSQQIDSRMYPEWLDVGPYPPIVVAVRQCWSNNVSIHFIALQLTFQQLCK